MVLGSEVPLDCLEQKPEKLGKGGNGTVFIHPLLNEEYAVKLVSQYTIHTFVHILYNVHVHVHVSAGISHIVVHVLFIRVCTVWVWCTGSISSSMTSYTE